MFFAIRHRIALLLLLGLCATGVASLNGVAVEGKATAPAGEPAAAEEYRPLVEDVLPEGDVESVTQRISRGDVVSKKRGGKLVALLVLAAVLVGIISSVLYMNRARADEGAGSEGHEDNGSSGADERGFEGAH